MQKEEKAKKESKETGIKRSFFQNMRSELKKVIWPTGKQTMKSTFVTIGFVLLISAILIIFNLFFNFLSAKWYDLILKDNNTDTNQIVSGEVSGDSNLLENNANVSGESGEGTPTENSGENASIVE